MTVKNKQHISSLDGTASLFLRKVDNKSHSFSTITVRVGGNTKKLHANPGMHSAAIIYRFISRASANWSRLAGLECELQ